MGWQLLGQHSAVQITFGGPQSAMSPTWGTAAAVKARMKSGKVDNSAVTTDVSTLADEIEQNVMKRKKARVELELFIPAAGPIGVDEDGEPLIGHYCRIQLKNLASMTGWRTWEGLLTGQSEDIPDGEQVERLVIDVGAAGIAYGSSYAAPVEGG